MRKTIIALLLTTSTFAYAGDYSEANNKIAMCKIVSELSAHAFLGKDKGPPTPAAKQGYEDLYALAKFAKEYGYVKAVSMEDAYMSTWAKCMDNVEYLTRETKVHGQIAEELLY